MCLNSIQIKKYQDEALEKVCESGTDAIMVGGTDGVTLENVLRFNGAS